MPEIGLLESILANLVHDYPNHSTYWYASAAGIEPSLARRRLDRLAREGHLVRRRFLASANAANYWGTSRLEMTPRLLSQPEPEIEWAV